jgi:transcriptional regulator with XRE-family HTH domain
MLSSDQRRRHGSVHPHPVDVHVGVRLRDGRTVLGMSQGKLGDAIGVAFQQVQKYESGANRISASRLYELSRVLEVPVTYFFEELDQAALAGTQVAGLSELSVENYFAEHGNREVLELARAFQRISDVVLRERLLNLVKAVASTYSHS